MRIKLKVFSVALLREVIVEGEIPYEFSSSGTFRVIWALHSAMRDGEFFFESLNARAVAKNTNSAIIAPCLGNNFFINTGNERQEDCLEELFQSLCNLLPFEKARNKHGVLGISMGGFGALAWALRSSHFGSVATISGVFSALIKPDDRYKKDRNQKMLYGTLNKIMHEHLLAPASECVAPGADFENMLKLHSSFPKISFFCGEEDYLSLPQNLFIYKLINAYGANARLILSPGGHDEVYWTQVFARAAGDLFKED